MKQYLKNTKQLIFNYIKKNKTPSNLGIVYSLKIIFGLSIAYLIGKSLHITSLWTLITVVVVSDPDFKTASAIAKLRFYNTCLGCVVGVIGVWTLGVSFYSLLLSVFITIYFSHVFVKQANWRLAPASTIIIYSGYFSNNEMGDLSPTYLAIQRCLEIVAGCCIALGLSFFFTFINQHFSKKIPKVINISKKNFFFNKIQHFSKKINIFAQ